MTATEQRPNEKDSPRQTEYAQEDDTKRVPVMMRPTNHVSHVIIGGRVPRTQRRGLGLRNNAH